jgi:hypothetical protein
MHLSRCFALKLTRSVGASLVMLAALMLVDGVVQAPAAAQALPVAPSTVHPRPPLSPYAQSALASSRIWKRCPPLCHPERSRGICGAPRLPLKGLSFASSHTHSKAR